MLCRGMNVRAKEQKVAVTVWGERVSPVFDSARTLLIAEIHQGTLVGMMRVAFDPQRPLELLQLLRTQQVRCVICGAVSEGPAAMLEGAGVRLIPFITGEVERVLAHYVRGRAFGMEFCMPGCGRGRCCRTGRQQGGRPPVSCSTPAADGARERRAKTADCPASIASTTGDDSETDPEFGKR